MKNGKPIPLEKLLHSKSGILLDLGCGHAKQQGYVGMDKRNLPEVDIVWDIEDTPWPLPDDCCTQILCSHLLEHTYPGKFFNIMGEMHRVSRHACQVLVAVPYAGSYGAFQDPTHVHPGYNEATWTYLDPRPINGRPNILYAIYHPQPFFIERCNWDVGGNMEVILRVIKDEKFLKKAMRAAVKTRVAKVGRTGVVTS